MAELFNWKFYWDWGLVGFWNACVVLVCCSRVYLGLMSVEGFDNLKVSIVSLVKGFGLVSIKGFGLVYNW